MVSTPLVSLGRLSVTWSFRNSTVFGKTSGTGQMHCSKSAVNLCVAIAVSATDSIVLTGTVKPSILSQMNPVDIKLPKPLRCVIILFL